ncbi:hypothetical protein SPIRO4BDMA_40561 [uncultured spirochete]|uniref:Uncharacterized protein n=1 Tax=uncultured spirochete TaxID=156406 RepID=A0A3P3XPM8_9SPIR|nr:hypothetical protein SPIRO4BDMA_40561 [uncultured spirochete]
MFANIITSKKTKQKNWRDALT